jgi:DUF1680 family protein
VVYCFETPRNQDDERIWNAGVFLPENAQFTPRHDRSFLGSVTVLTGRALTSEGRNRFIQENAAASPPKRTSGWTNALYRKLTPRQLKPPETSTLDITLIPYFAWANRGPSLMEVWIPLAR